MNPPAVLHASGLGRAATVVSWVAQVLVAIILGQTLFFKLMYAPETAYIFETRGGRPAATAIAIVELIAVILLLIPRRAALGALISLVVIGGAIVTHITDLGIEVKDPTTGEGDGGTLFILAIVVALGSIVVLAIRWRSLPIVGPWLGRNSVQIPAGQSASTLPR